MKIEKNRLVYLSLIICFVTIGCIIFYRHHFINCNGCGGCEYENFSEKAYISNFDMDNSGNPVEIEFTFSNYKNRKDISWQYSENNIWPDYFKDSSILKDTTILYRIKGTQIIKGTCTPYWIESIEKLTD